MKNKMPYQKQNKETHPIAEIGAHFYAINISTLPQALYIQIR